MSLPLVSVLVVAGRRGRPRLTKDQPNLVAPQTVRLIAGLRDPFVGLHACNQDRRTRIVRLVDERLPFLDIRKVLSEGIGDVGLVRKRLLTPALGGALASSLKARPAFAFLPCGFAMADALAAPLSVNSSTGDPSRPASSRPVSTARFNRLV